MVHLINRKLFGEFLLATGLTASGTFERSDLLNLVAKIREVMLYLMSHLGGANCILGLKFFKNLAFNEMCSTKLIRLYKNYVLGQV